MIIHYLPEGKLSLPAVLPLNSSPYGEHYWDAEHEKLCDVYWLLAECIALILRMQVVGYDYAGSAIVIAPTPPAPPPKWDEEEEDWSDKAPF